MAKTHQTRAVDTASTAAAVYVDVAELRPNPRNPRVHRAEVANLARTILRTAWGAPIVAQQRSKRIIGGHGRLEAAKLILAGLEVDGEMRGGAEHFFDRGAPGPGMVPVRYVDVSDVEADAMTLADNAKGLQGVDDPTAIVEMAAQFGRESAAMADMGFDGEALDALVKSAGDAVLASGAQAPRDGQKAGDAATEWEGMPEYDAGGGHSRLWVSFKTAEDRAEFFGLVGQTDTGSTKSVWFPPQERRDLEGLRWQGDDE